LRQAGMFEPAAVNALYEKLNSYGQLADMSDYYRVMRMEWALMTVLSVQILYRLFVLGESDKLN